MEKTVYTNYWQNRLTKQKKEHGSYKTEDEAIKGIEAWWELHKEDYSDVEYRRTNSGALEIIYNGDDYVYRIEKRKIDSPLPSRSYTLKKPGEIEALRSKYQLHDEAFLFDELAEPYRDRLVLTMADSKKVREFIYDENGCPIQKLEEIKATAQSRVR